MSPLIDHLRRHGNSVAVLTGSRQLTYSALANLVETVAHDLGAQRRLVLLETRNDIHTLVHYLAALAHGHVVLPLRAGGDHRPIVATYRPDVVIDGAGVHLLHPTGGHVLHDDLALLMSTSGSTGSPKLVRLSRANLIANAAAIAQYLRICKTDRAATTLPMSYCYGLSVIHSHLLVGAAVVLTEQSVADAEFWELFRRHRGTTFAGVPYTFELLEQVRFAEMDLPHLRYLTQAGGRMPPERVRQFATLGERRGWQLFVMYGATEATARMAYLPPELACKRPDAIGRPIPGGSFSLEPVEDWHDDGTGELVYRGANVMMGYAHSADDLALGPTVDALHTGDIARRGTDGLYEVIGRTSRFVKIYGLRIDLQQVETALRDRGVPALCADNGDRLAVVACTDDPRDLKLLTSGVTGLPTGAIDSACVRELPTLPSGKPDYQTSRALAAESAAAQPQGSHLPEIFAQVLQLDPADIDRNASFVDLGGNSLSYVSMSVRLQRALSWLPADWQRLSLRELEALPAPRPSRWHSRGATLETSVALRAVAIILVVGSHADLFRLWGGAHVLLGIAGYNFGRFCLTPVPRTVRIRHLRNTIGWIAVPSMVWIAIALVFTHDYRLTNLVLANKFLGPHDSMTAGRLWFVEVIVWVLIALAVLFWLPAVDRLERRYSFGVAAAFLAFGLALRYDVAGLDLGRDAWFTVLTFWFFAAGWAAAKATTIQQRTLVTAVLVVGLQGYFDSTHREALVITGLVLLIWLPAVRCPAAVAVAAGVVAEASLYIYLTHYQLYPLFGSHRLVGVIASVVVGVALTAAVTSLRDRLRIHRLNPPDSAQAPALR